MANNEDFKHVFAELYSLNVNDKTETKNGLTYLSWAYAIGEVRKRFTDFEYEIFKDELNRPYIYDENLGYMVFTKVTIAGKTSEMWLPVLDSANKPMKNTPYKYKTKKGEFVCEAATMFDINRSIMRCLVKNIATACGLGLYIYSKEDIPEDIKAITCSKCGDEIVDAGGATAAQLIAATKQKYGKPICKHCIDLIVADRAKAEKEKAEAPKPELNEAAIAEIANAGIPFEVME